MKTAALAFGFASFALATAASASPIPYPNPGTPAPTLYITATATGDVQATLYSALGLDDDRIGLLDLTTGYDSGFVVYTHQAPLGTLYNFGHVNAGDQLEFYLKNNNPVDAAQTFYSDPTLSTDGYNHVYEYATGQPDATGQLANVTYLGFQDIPEGFAFSGDSFNASALEATNLTLSSTPPMTPTPEPGTLSLLGTGVLGIAGLVRRRFKA